MKRRGFTLLEVLVATTIMGIAVAGVLSALSSTIRNAARLTDYDRAVMLSRSKMDELLLDPHLPPDAVVQGNFDPAVMGGFEGGWRARLTVFDAPPGYPKEAAETDQTLDRLELQIWWISNGRRSTFSAVGYRTDPVHLEDRQP